MKDILLVVTAICVGGFLISASDYLTDAKPCHTFERTDTSHIRFNNCTGEAHVIVRGPNGFEWQRIID